MIKIFIGKYPFLLHFLKTKKRVKKLFLLCWCFIICHRLMAAYRGLTTVDCPLLTSHC